MIRGRLGSGGEPVVTITLHGRRPRAIEAVLDTGFSGHLCLSRRQRSFMRLRRVGRQPFELADGHQVIEDVFLGEVTFDGRRQRVLVTLTAARESLVGTDLLAAKVVRIDFARAKVTVTNA